VAQPKLAGEAR